MAAKRIAFRLGLVALLSFLLSVNLSCVWDEVLRPAGDGIYQELWVSIDRMPDHYDEVDDAIPDDDASVVYLATGITHYFTDTYSFTDLNWDEDIESLLLTFRYQREGLNPSYIKPALYINGTLYFGAEIYIPLSSTEWVAVSECFATSPDTGLAWTADEVNNSEFGVSIRGIAATAVECTQFTMRVEYDSR